MQKCFKLHNDFFLKVTGFSTVDLARNGEMKNLFATLRAKNKTIR